MNSFVVCFALSDSQAHEISPRLRSLLRRPAFSTKKERMGKVVRVTNRQISYYSFDDRQIRVINLGG
jgi:hypothetical protein